MRVAALALLLLALGAMPARADVTVTEEKAVKDRVVDLTITTPAFSAPTKVEVFLPTGYDADPARRWPVTYVLAGTMNNYDSFRKVIKGDELSKDYPSIIVSPDGNSGYWSDWYNGGAFGPPQYETFVIDQLLPLIDGRYRTAPDRAHRAIVGVSMGGYGAMMMAARHPDLFAAAGSISGAVNTNNAAIQAALTGSSSFDGGAPDAIYGPRSSQEVRWRGHNPVDLANNLRGMDLQVRTANGVPAPGIGEDPLSADSASCVVEGGVHFASIDFHNALDELGIPHAWKDYGSGCHTKPNFARQTTDTLRRFAEVLAAPTAAPARIDYRSIEPAFTVWGWHVEADPARALEFLALDDAGRGGATFTGSGRTAVTTPPFFRRLRTVDVEGTPTAVTPDGRVAFTVDLGPAAATQEYTPGAAPARVSSKVRFAPHARLMFRGVRRSHACVRVLGPRVDGLRVVLGGRVVRRRTGCLRFAASRRARTIRATGTDRFGHIVRARAMIPKRR